MSLNKEQLQFFFDEVMGELGWCDEIEETGVDPLAYVRDEISGLRRHIKRLEHDRIALLGSLGNPVPEGHDGLLSNGSSPKNVLAEYLAAQPSGQADEIRAMDMDDIRNPRYKKSH